MQMFINVIRKSLKSEQWLYVLETKCSNQYTNKSKYVYNNLDDMNYQYMIS